MAKQGWLRLRGAVLVALLLLGLVAVASCRPAPPAADKTGEKPPAAGGSPALPPAGEGRAGAPGGEAPAGDGGAPAPPNKGWAGPAAAAELHPALVEGRWQVGPFANLRSVGWVNPGVAWGWGDLGSSQAFFTLGTDGAFRARDIPQECEPAGPHPLPEGAGFVSLHYPQAGEAPQEMTGWYVPMEGEPVCLGPAEGLQLSPSGRWLLRFCAQGTFLHDTLSWRAAPIPAIPPGGFPYAGLDVTWIDDSLVAVRHGPGSTEGRGLRLVRLPDGSVAGELSVPGQYLAPLPAPGAEWLAVLHINAETALFPEEAVHPVGAGQAITVYSRSSLASPQPVATAALALAGGMAAGLTWSEDGSRLAYAAVAGASLGEAGFGVSYDGPSRVLVASAPGFETEALPLDPGPVCLPLCFSPGGRYLALESSAEGGQPGVGLLWDFVAGKAVPLPQGLRLYYVEWIGEDQLCACAADPSGGLLRPVLVDAATGERAGDVPWAAPYWSPSPAGYLALKRPLEPGDPLAGPDMAWVGGWLVLYPTRKSP
ncbi:MAG: hypothetical protein K6T75_00445 [Acetobacteraceae bacterium]|nr:hypothetical protein [Acetobacteraceae bacterium]